MSWWGAPRHRSGTSAASQPPPPSCGFHVPCSYYSKLPQMWWFKMTEFCSLRVLKAEVRMRVLAGPCPLRAGRTQSSLPLLPLLALALLSLCLPLLGSPALPPLGEPCPCI